MITTLPECRPPSTHHNELWFIKFIGGDQPERHEEGDDAASYDEEAEGAPDTGRRLVHIHLVTQSVRDNELGNY